MNSRGLFAGFMSCFVMLGPGWCPVATSQPAPKKDNAAEIQSANKALVLARQPFTPRARSGYHTVTFSPDGKRLASIVAKGTGQVWDGTTGKAVLTLVGHTREVFDLAYSPDGKWIASAGQDGGKIWDAATGKLHFTTTGQNWVDRVAFSPDAKRLATAGSPGVRVWDVAAGKNLAIMPGNRTWESTVAFSPDGACLASGNILKIVTIWDSATGSEKLSLKGHSGPIHTVAYRPDGKHLASASVDKTVRIWDAATGKEIMCLKGHTGPVHTVAYSPDNKLLLTASSDKTARLWDVLTGAEVLILNCPMPVFCAVFSPDGQRLAATTSDGQVFVWLLAVAGRPPAVLTPENLESLWADLKSSRPPRAFQAIFTLASAPRRTLPFLKKRLRPAAADPDLAGRLARLIAGLDDQRYAVRRNASRELEQLGMRAEPTLKRALEEAASAEVRRSAKRLLDKLAAAQLSPEQLLAQRATDVLERIGTPEAKALLERLARGADGVWLTQEARASLGRLGAMGRGKP
jgi:WD40 repeat protein